jgi:hypothetical protein
MFKNFIRYYLGKFFQLSPLSSVIRHFYRSWAQIYSDRLIQHSPNGVWLRRSVTNQDFMPFWSDIDLTIILKKNELLNFSLNKDLFVHDIQVLSDKHLDSWLRTGGFRNRQIPEWIKLHGSEKIYTPQIESAQTLAFELAHEFYLLYHQLESKLHQNISDKWAMESAYKLLAELERVHLFWQSKDSRILSLTREQIFPRKNYDSKLWPQYLSAIDGYCQSIFQSLCEPLASFDFQPLVKSSGENYSILNLKILGKPVVVCHKADLIPKLIALFPTSFVCSPTFVKMIKGVGVQEQSLLNKLIHDRSSYYFHFNLQRLANDLLGAFVLNPGGHEQLYYCFKNINDFSMELLGNPVPGWNEGKVTYHSSQELLELINRYLEVLESLS